MKYVGCHVVMRTGHCSRFANAERSEDAYLQYLHTGFLGFLEGEKAITDGREPGPEVSSSGSEDMYSQWVHP